MFKRPSIPQLRAKLDAVAMLLARLARSMQSIFAETASTFVGFCLVLAGSVLTVYPNILINIMYALNGREGSAFYSAVQDVITGPFGATIGIACTVFGLVIVIVRLNRHLTWLDKTIIAASVLTILFLLMEFEARWYYLALAVSVATAIGMPVILGKNKRIEYSIEDLRKYESAATQINDTIQRQRSELERLSSERRELERQRKLLGLLIRSDRQKAREKFSRELFPDYRVTFLLVGYGLGVATVLIVTVTST